MTELTIIRSPCPGEGVADGPGGAIRLRADRGALAKRRWRGVAEDGREFGFDLEHPLAHGACFFCDGGTRYVVEQDPEPVLEIPLADAAEAARIAWQLGNLHLSVEVLPAILRTPDHPAARRMLAQQRIAFRVENRVFVPLSGGAGHHRHAHE